VQILGISENNPFSHKAFVDSLKLPYPLLSDMSLDVIKRYGVLYGSTPGEGKIEYPELVGRVARRAFFLIDRDGIIRGKWLGQDLSVLPSEEFLAGYGPDYHATGRQAARLVGKIIKGEKPAEIPVESNPRIHFAINLKVAKQIGLRISPEMVTRADQVFQ
jgi:hypothetical protein